MATVTTTAPTRIPNRRRLPRRNRKSALVACACCGSPMSFAGERWPGEIHLFLPSFEDPAALSPEMHVHAAEQLPWVHLHDHLPRYLRTAREGPPLR